MSDECPLPVDAFYIPHETVPIFSFILPFSICALELNPTEYGSAALGSSTKLGPGEWVEIFGAGFNDQTVKVRCGAKYYFVSEGDLRRIRSVRDALQLEHF
jgi:hypothetical protein